jgi:excisionase family DNA binding protein
VLGNSGVLGSGGLRMSGGTLDLDGLAQCLWHHWGAAPAAFSKPATDHRETFEPEFHRFGDCLWLRTLIGLGESGKSPEKGCRMAQSLAEYALRAEAAKVLGVPPKTLRAWAEAGLIPMHRNPANGFRLFRRSNFDRFLKQVSRPVKPK